MLYFDELKRIMLYYDELKEICYFNDLKRIICYKNIYNIYKIRIIKRFII